MIKNVLLVGATGAVGSMTLKKLCENKELKKIIVLTRKHIEVNDLRIMQIMTDFKNLNRLEIGPVDAGLCALGTTIKDAGSPDLFKTIDHDLVISVAQICKSLGAKSFGVVSALGANSNSQIFYNKVKGEMEDDLQKMNFNILTILRPSLLLGERAEFRLGEKIMGFFVPLINPLLMGNLKRYRAIPIEKVADHLCCSLFNKESSVIENEKMLI